MKFTYSQYSFVRPNTAPPTCDHTVVVHCLSKAGWSSNWLTLAAPVFVTSGLVRSVDSALVQATSVWHQMFVSGLSFSSQLLSTATLEAP